MASTAAGASFSAGVAVLPGPVAGVSLVVVAAGVAVACWVVAGPRPNIWSRSMKPSRQAQKPAPPAPTSSTANTIRKIVTAVKISASLIGVKRTCMAAISAKGVKHSMIASSPKVER